MRDNGPAPASAARGRLASERDRYARPYTVQYGSTEYDRRRSYADRIVASGVSDPSLPQPNVHVKFRLY